MTCGQNKIKNWKKKNKNQVCTTGILKLLKLGSMVDAEWEHGQKAEYKSILDS